MSIPNRIAILNTDGSTQTGFDPGEGLNAEGLCVAALPGGRVVAGGAFTSAGGQARARLAVFAETGALAPGAVPEESAANGPVRFLTCQADGRIIVGGDFTELGGLARLRVARLKNTLGVEAAFDAPFDAPAHAAAPMADGRVVVGGAFAQAGGAAHDGLARLTNDVASSLLRVKDAFLVQWLRAGSAPETGRVTFECSTDDGGLWEPMGGEVSRIPGGWQAIDSPGEALGLPASGLIRARAMPTDGHGAGVVESTAAFDFVPEIQVELQDEDKTILLSGTGAYAYKPAQVGAAQEQAFVIRNTGLASLSLTGSTPVTITGSGTNAAQFSIIQPDLLTLPEEGASTTFKVTFAPVSEGSKTVVLHIASDDDDEGDYQITLTGVALPGPGSRDLSVTRVEGVDTIFQPIISHPTQPEIHALAAAMTHLELGGTFNAVNGNTLANRARLTYAGALIYGGDGANKTVNACVQLPDGAWLIGGAFTSVAEKTRGYLARLNANGTRDAGFPSIVLNGEVMALAVDAAGGVIVGGAFTSFGGKARKYVARLTAQSAVDASFDPSANGKVMTMAVRQDKKILIGGAFTKIGGTDRAGLARLNENGTLDASFNAGLQSTGILEVHAAAFDAEGRALIGGAYEKIGGADHWGLNRLTESGAWDATFAQTSRDVRTIAVQADGRIIAGGGVYKGAGVKLFRVESDGTEDSTFISGISGGVINALALAADGRLFVGGAFSIGSSAKLGLIKVVNDPGSSTLSLEDNNSTVRWERKGAAPETQHVVFDVSEDSGATWPTTLGPGVRITDGWQLTGVRLPFSGHLRARARVISGHGCGSAALQEEIIPLPAGLIVPELTVEYPINTAIPHGGGTTLPAMLPGATSPPRTLTLRNTGRADLTGLAATGSAEFQIIDLTPQTVPPGGTAVLTLTFRPSKVGLFEHKLQILSNVAGIKNPYTLTLSGAGIAAPTATTLGITLLTTTQARLNAQVKPNSQSALIWFEYKTTAATAWTKAPAPPREVSGFDLITLYQDISGLTPGATYQYRVFIYNSVNTAAAPAAGAILSFTTPV